MENKNQFIGPRIDRIIEVERITREGATLKNVSDNLRALTVIVAFAFAIGLLWKEAYPAAKLVAVLWGSWLLFFTAMTILQSGFLFMVAVSDNILVPYFHKKQKLWPFIAWLFACLTFAFIMGALGILGTFAKLAPK